MKVPEFKTSRALMFLAAGLLAASGAMAEKPEWAGGGKQGKPEQKHMQSEPSRPAQGDGDGHGHAGPRQSQADPSGRSGSSAHGPQGKSVQVGGYFGDAQRTAVHSYYGEQYRVGRCPPGLAKKNNGCMPPGQARKWTMGRLLPRDVIYYSVPSSVVMQLGVPPAGHRYVRVAADILLIAVGTGMVVDAIQDLGGM